MASNISSKLVKLESLNLVDSFILALSTRMKYNISKRGVPQGHVTSRIFGIPSNMSPKPVKLESSNLEHNFIFACPARLKYNILERGCGLGHMTPGKFGLSSTLYTKPVKTDCKLGTLLRLVPCHNVEV